MEAVDTQTKQRVAIKIIRAVPKYRDASKMEIRVLKKLKESDPLNRQCVRCPSLARESLTVPTANAYTSYRGLIIATIYAWSRNCWACACMISSRRTTSHRFRAIKSSHLRGNSSGVWRVCLPELTVRRNLTLDDSLARSTPHPHRPEAREHLASTQRLQDGQDTCPEQGLPSFSLICVSFLTSPFSEARQRTSGSCYQPTSA